jgi:peptide/nickel transport system permease protein
MLVYIARRMLMIPLVLFLSTLLLFLLIQLIPPTMRLGIFLDQSFVPSQSIESLLHQHALDQPMYMQWYTWISGIFQGNLGWSESASLSVWDAIANFFPATLELSLVVIGPLVWGGIWLGVQSAKFQNRFPDHVVRLFTVLATGVPPFVSGIILLMLFFGHLGWVSDGRLSVEGLIITLDPAYQHFTGMHTLDALLNGRLGLFFDAAAHLILPALTLILAGWAFLGRVMRASMLDALYEDYTMTARAKGVRERTVINKHARRNAMIPILTLIGNVVVILLSGFVVVEIVFNFKGMGWWFVKSAIQLDIPAVLGFTIFTGMIIVVVNLLVDISYAYADPKIRYD